MPSDDSIILVEHDPAWHGLFHAERDRLRKLLGPNVQIIHVGSTAVPGLSAKPIIDIMVAEQGRRGPDHFVPLLASLGFVNVPHDEDADRLFFRKVPRTCHVHVVEKGSWTYWKHILLRDHLIHNAADRMEYDRLKRDLATRFKEDRNSYTENKSSLIEAMIRRAWLSSVVTIR